MIDNQEPATTKLEERQAMDNFKAGLRRKGTWLMDRLKRNNPKYYQKTAGKTRQKIGAT